MTVKTEDKAALLENMLAQIIADPRYQEGITYGKPRKGHEEGSVKNHIAELRETLYEIRELLSEEEFAKLSILIHVHDTFKLEGKRLSDHQVSLRDPRSHASLARKFLSEFTTDESILAIAQWHDEGHGLWKQVEAKGKFSRIRLDEALQNIPDLELYLLFTVIDGWTESKLKDRSPKWFLDVVYNHCVPPKPYRAYEALMHLEKNR